MELFSIQLEKVIRQEELLTALSIAFGISTDEIDLQYSDKFNDAPKKRLFCLVAEDEGGDGWFPVILTLSISEANSNENEVMIASKISNTLNISCLVSSGRALDDDTRLLIRGFDKPKLVIICEKYDELHDRSNYFLIDY